MTVGNGANKNTQGKYNALTTVSELTRAVHDGKAFSIGAEGTIPPEISIYLLGKVGNTPAHFDEFTADFSQGNVRISLYEAPTITEDGTPVIPANMNFESNNTPTLSVFSGPTITDDGILKPPSKFVPLTGSGANVSPGSGGVAKGRVLKRNTNYLIKIENIDTNTAVSFGSILIWHETDIILP